MVVMRVGESILATIVTSLVLGPLLTSRVLYQTTMFKLLESSPGKAPLEIQFTADGTEVDSPSKMVS